MKSIRNIGLATLVFLLAGSFNGCKKFLDSELQGQLTQDSYPTTASDALLSTNAVYQTTRDWYYHSGGYPILDIMSDDAHKGSNPNDQLATLGPYDNFTFTTTQDGLDRWWATLYLGIKRANVVIEKVPDIPMDETLKNRYLAEAKFLRALYYFDLVRAWGGVPLVLTLETPSKMPRSTADEVYLQIIEDLTFSVDFLPLKSEYNSVDAGRATKGAAQSLLGKAYLYRKDFVSAAGYFQQVITSAEYDLETEFVNVCGVGGENGVESIFAVGALQVEGTENGGDQYANTQGVRGTPNKGWGFNRPSEDLRHSFASGDPRLEFTIIDLGQVIDGITILGDGTTPDISTNDAGEITERECYNRKVWVPGSTTVSEWGHYRRLILYADVLLMAAEALNENGNPAQALVYLNQVRARARGGNPDILPDITTTDKDTLRMLIYQERRQELAMEGIRFWDLVRTGRAPQVLGPLGFVTGKHELLPIPQNEIDISQGALIQNPNWN
ncbi:MAG: RagB/SusD family nutrient uptake outer membrane protein [Bacteroidales bacterium]|nr:RagB/SusD family nutrient uptake outer membrane protein [Bacteroidales bacterium]